MLGTEDTVKNSRDIPPPVEWGDRRTNNHIYTWVQTVTNPLEKKIQVTKFQRCR